MQFTFLRCYLGFAEGRDVLVKTGQTISGGHRVAMLIQTHWVMRLIGGFSFRPSNMDLRAIRGRYS